METYSVPLWSVDSMPPRLREKNAIVDIRITCQIYLGLKRILY